VSPQPRFSPLFRRLLWGVRETKKPAPRNTRYYSLLAKEVWRNFRELRHGEVRRISHLRTPVNKRSHTLGTASQLETPFRSRSDLGRNGSFRSYLEAAGVGAEGAGGTSGVAPPDCASFIPRLR
jgi:hypothetical protein